MMLPLDGRSVVAAALVLGQGVFGTSSALSSEFDGRWSVNIVAEDMNCPNSTIPVQVSDGAISFSGFGATATGQITESGSIRLEIASGEDAVSIHGKARAGAASGIWKMASAGCEGRWSAQILE